VGLRLVALQPFLHQAVNRLLILPALHVDEIADDQAADISQAQLARDLVSGFEVGLEDRFFHIAAALVAPGVYVDGHQRLGFVDHNVAAAFQPDLAVKGVVDLFLHAEGFKDRRRAIV
jgi:hypothetical protein